MSWLTDMYRRLRGDEPPVAQPPTIEPPKDDFQKSHSSALTTQTDDKPMGHLTPAPKKRPKNKTAKRKKR